MKKILIICSVVCLVCSCQKETMPKLELVDVSTRVESINSPECNGSSITVILEVNQEAVMIENIQNQYLYGNGGGGVLNSSASDWSIDADGNLRNNWCYTFEDSDWVEEKYKLIGMTEMGQTIESKEVSVRIERPAGSAIGTQ